jgi:hypothetical protein
MTRPCRASRAVAASLGVFGLLILGVADARAQSDTAAVDSIAADAPAHIAFVDGTAVLERDGQPDDSPLNMPLLAGDRVRTEAGRVEIAFADGSTLHLDERTTVDFQSDELVRLLAGRLRLAIPGPDRAVSYRIDAPSASVEVAQPGEYRVAVTRPSPEEIELAVLRGAAELVNDRGNTALRAGQRAYARPDVAPSGAYVFNSASWDAFDRWSEARRDERRGVSTQYLPDQVRSYAASFDRYGSWGYDASYGNVWYPSVAAEWRPYHYGRWVTLRPYGWTWVGSDAWAWPTHHYGRWGVSAGVWFWIPGRSWGPAWVSWAYAPGYVSWCPLGWNNRPIFQINLHTYDRRYDPWRAWTVVPQRQFGVGYVNARHVPGERFDARGRAAFVQRNSGPEMRGYSVPRASAPIRVAGTGGGRLNTPVYTNLGSGASRVGSGGSRIVVPSGTSPSGVSRGDADATAGQSRAVPRVGVTQSGQPRTSGTAEGGYTATDRRFIRSEPGTRTSQPREEDTQPGQTRSRLPAPDSVYAAPDRRAVPRDRNVYGGSSSRGASESPGTGTNSSAGRPAPRAYDVPTYRSDPSGRRTQEPRPTSGGVNGRAPDDNRAVPRAVPEMSRPSPQPAYRDGGRAAPQDNPRPSPQPAYRDGGGTAPERRAPAAEGPAARPPDRAPERSRSGGEPSSGTAVRRSGGRR